jgi:hypothetical protein
MTDSGTSASDAERKEEQRRLRRQRQTTKNLVASLVVSLGIVLLLVLVVPRPAGNQVASIDWTVVASQSAESAPGPLIVPVLDATWQANRADLRQSGVVTEWTVGLISSTGEFVSVVQGFGADRSWVSDQVLGQADSGEVSLGASPEGQVSWIGFDRSAVANPGNRVFAVATPTADGWVIVSGMTETSVTAVAADISTHNITFLGGP